MSRVAFHSPLVTEYVVPVVAIFTTGTEGGDKVLWDVNSKTARGGEVLLTQPAGGAIVVASIPFDECLGFFSDPVRFGEQDVGSTVELGFPSWTISIGGRSSWLGERMVSKRAELLLDRV